VWELAAFNTTAKRLFDGFDRQMMQAARLNLLELTAQVLRHPRLIRAIAPGRSLAQLLARYFTDPHLRQLFGRHAIFVGGSFLQSPAELILICNPRYRVSGG
jgi:1-hydroxycarotenoid 3,4-desaturase